MEGDSNEYLDIRDSYLEKEPEVQNQAKQYVNNIKSQHGLEKCFQEIQFHLKEYFLALPVWLSG